MNLRPDSGTGTQVAAEVSWLARSAKTRPGFGRALFEYAVSVALDAGATAIVVTPHNDKTAEKIWKERFHFEPAPQEDQPAGAPPRLWYPIRPPDPPV